MHRQRRYRKKLSQERREKLANIEFTFDSIIENNWNEMYELLKKYYEHHGHTDVLQNFKTTNGYEADENGRNLGHWVSSQRQQRDKLPKERRQKLAEINFIYNIIEYEWNEMYELLKKYYEHHGHTNIPGNFKTTNGYEEDENGKKLGIWVFSQRKVNDKLSPERKKKLAEVDFIYDVYEYEWNEMYELLKKYYEHHGHTNIIARFKTINGYEEDENGFALGTWVRRQRQGSNNLLPEQIQKLKEVNFIYDVYEYEWNEMYELLKKYYEYHGHTNVTARFKTINGYEEDENGKALGRWANKQKKLKDQISDEQYHKLECLEFKFSTKKEHITNIKELCNQHRLNYEKYKILSNIPYQELYAKIAFLHENNIPLEINSELNPIFGMSNENMKVIHGISKEELISKYYINSSKKGL